jgi:hypothetical protein
VAAKILSTDKKSTTVLTDHGQQVTFNVPKYASSARAHCIAPHRILSLSLLLLLFCIRAALAVGRNCRMGDAVARTRAGTNPYVLPLVGLCVAAACACVRACVRAPVRAPLCAGSDWSR